MPKVGQQRRLETGVYLIRNINNGKIYVGSAAKSFESRWKVHVNDLRANRHRNIHLQRSWNKHGEPAFVFSVIERAESEQCIEREQAWIYKMIEDGETIYNRYLTAGSPLGSKHSEESREKMSEKAKQRDNHFQSGHKHSVAALLKMSATRRGKKPSEASNVKRSASLLAFYADEERSRAVREEQSRRSKGQIGRIPSLETRAKMAAAKKGKKQTKEHIANRVAKQLGRPMPKLLGNRNAAGTRSDEIKQKMRVARLAYLQRKREENGTNSPQETERPADGAA